MRVSKEPLIEPAAIATKIKEIAGRIASEYNSNPLTYVAIMGGAFVFLSDLIREVGLNARVDFLWLSSYEDVQSTGRVRVIRDLGSSPAGRNVLLVDDILDTGRTLAFARELLINKGAADVKVAVLLEKNIPKYADIKADYVGFSIENKFVVGYGLDYNENYRHLSGIYVLEE